MTVTSVGLSDGSTTPIYTISGSPVTTSGTLTLTLKTQAPNTVLAGPSSGAAAQPSFRALTTSDIPAFGVFSPTFQSGYLQYIGSTGTITGNTNFLVGLDLPSPLGGSVPGLLVGSGVPNAVIITDTVAGSTTPGINLAIAALSNVFKTTFTASVTTAPTVSNPSDGQTVRWFITQDATGGRTMTWPTSFKWPGGTKGVLSTAASAVDMLEATFVAATSSWYATLTKAFS